MQAIREIVSDLEYLHFEELTDSEVASGNPVSGTGDAPFEGNYGF